MERLLAHATRNYIETHDPVVRRGYDLVMGMTAPGQKILWFRSRIL